MPAADRDPIDRLDAYLDAVATGRPISEDAVDPAWQAIDHQVRSLDRAPAPPSSFAARLLEDLMQTHALATTPGRQSLPLQNGRVGQLSGDMPHVLPSSGRRWAPVHFATAALLLLGLIGTVLIASPQRFAWPQNAPVFLPAISGTPTTSETVVTETLVDVPVDDLPTGLGTAAVLRWTLEPGPRPLVLPAQDGPRFVVVESGEVTVTEAEREHHLSAGDVYFAADPEEDLRINVRGSESAVLYRGYVAKAWQAASWDTPAQQFVWLIEVDIDELPGGSGRLILEQLTLPAGSALPPLEASPWVWFEVEESTLGVTLEGEELPVGWTEGKERTLGAGSSLVLGVVPAGTPMTLRNAGDGPLVLYRLALTPNDVGAAGTGTPAP